MSVRNQLTHYELGEFFRYLQDLLVLSLNASLSFNSAEFLSRRLDGFEITLSVYFCTVRSIYVCGWIDICTVICTV